MTNPGAFDAFVLDPRHPRPVDDFGPLALGVVDPLYFRYGAGGASLLEAKIAALRADLRQTMEAMVGALTHGNARGVINTALRGDWLYFETQLSQVIVELVWTARLLGDAPPTGEGGCEAALAALCRKTSSLPALERVLAPTDLKDQAIGLAEVIEASLRHIHARVGEFHVDTEDWFRWDTFEHRHEGPPRVDAARIAAAAERIAASLSAMPTCRGVCINGSFAETAKHDGLNDLDLCCYCTAVPDSKAKIEFFARLGMERQPRDDAFEYLQLDGVNTHLIFVRVESQLKALARLRSEGDESTCLHFLHAEFALSAYHLGRSRILYDPDGVVRGLQQGTVPYPDALRQRVKATWAPVWATWLRRFRDAMADNDRAHAWVAHRYGAEAVLRLLLAQRGLHANPIEPKWFPQETAGLPECQALKSAAAGASLQSQFATPCRLQDELLRMPRPAV